MSLNIDVFGEGHLAKTLIRAAERRGLRVADLVDTEVVFAAADVLDHGSLEAAKEIFDRAAAFRNGPPPSVVLVSQVPPGTTRKWAGDQSHRVYYQVDTIIVRSALARAYAPEQIVVGCADPNVALPLAYQEYLAVFDCPLLQMSYEQAELVKCGINYVLAKQIEAANDLALVAARVLGVDYRDVEEALRNDERIGQRAYLRPGKTNQHLDRDVTTVRRLMSEQLEWERRLGLDVS